MLMTFAGSFVSIPIGSPSDGRGFTGLSQLRDGGANSCTCLALFVSRKNHSFGFPTHHFVFDFERPPFHALHCGASRVIRPRHCFYLLDRLFLSARPLSRSWDSRMIFVPSVGITVTESRMRSGSFNSSEGFDADPIVHCFTKLLFAS